MCHTNEHAQETEDIFLDPEEFLRQLEYPRTCLTDDVIMCKVSPGRYLYRNYLLTDKGATALLQGKVVIVQRLYVFEARKLDTISELIELNLFEGGKVIVGEAIYSAQETHDGNHAWKGERNNTSTSPQLASRICRKNETLYLTNKRKSQTPYRLG